MAVLRRQSRGLSSEVSTVLGVPVGIAVPLQRRDPRLLLGLSLAEVVVFAAAVVTVALPLLGATAALGAVLLAARAGDQRRIVAITSTGVVVLAASVGGRPLAAVGTAPADLRFPPPSGIGVPVQLGERTWWVDRADFARLRRAREMLREEPDGRQ